MSWAKEEILQNLFRRFDGSRPELQDRLDQAYKEKYGVPMRKVKQRDVRAAYLEGPPGHGKTTTHREACREFAKLMGMKFIVDPSMRDMTRGAIDENTFVFSTVNLGGATSKHEIGGLMAKLKIGEQEFMGHLPDWRLAATMMGGYGYVLFDDYVTSSHQVQNACLDLLLGGSAGDMQFNAKEMAASKMKIQDGQAVMELDEAKLAKIEELGGGDMIRGSSPVHVGLAGNRGARDGNKTFPIVTATATRIQRMDVFDTAEAFIERSTNKHPDAVGDAHYSMFIRQNPELFTVIAKPQQGILPQMPTPRTHDALLDSISDLIHQKGGMAAIAKDTAGQADVVDNIQRLAGTHIGVEIQLDTKDDKGNAQYVFPSRAVGAFYTELFLGAVPLAEEIIREGKVNEELLTEKYNNGAEGDGMNFGYNFASALAQVAATAFHEKIAGSGIKKKEALISALSDAESPLSKDVRTTLSHLSMGISFLQKSFVTFALDKFNQRLAGMSPEIFEGSTYKIMPPSTMRTMMFGLIKDNTKYNTQELKETIVDAITMSGSAINAEHKQGRDKTIISHLESIKDDERRKGARAAAKAAV